MSESCSALAGPSSDMVCNRQSAQNLPSTVTTTGRPVETVVLTPEARSIWIKFNPHRQFHLLKTSFILLCLFDTIHWAYMLRDDDEISPNVWKFYLRISEYDQYYLILRMFADIFVCILGLGASMWTRKITFSLPCLLVQSMLICARGLTWIFRRRLPHDYRLEDLLFIAFEFILPFIWVLLSLGVMRTIRSILKYDRLHGGTLQPPVIVLTVKNDNDDSVQIEINP
uniref:Transmembrane protein n=1 Tax=Ascaris lumbricoides TaxID=6252 RepID=A0A0M3IMF3_ASCLU